MKQPEPENFQDKYEDKGAKCSNCWCHRLKTCPVLTVVVTPRSSRLWHVLLNAGEPHCDTPCTVVQPWNLPERSELNLMLLLEAFC